MWFRSRWEFLAAGAIPNHLHIAGVLQIPRSIVPPVEGAGARPIGCCFVQSEVKIEPRRGLIARMISRLRSDERKSTLSQCAAAK